MKHYIMYYVNHQSYQIMCTGEEQSSGRAGKVIFTNTFLLYRMYHEQFQICVIISYEADL